MRFLFIFTMGLFPLSALAVNDFYDCKQVADTSVSWSPTGQKYKADAEDSRANGLLVKIVDLNTDLPKLAGQSVTGLRLITRSDMYLGMLEITPAGTLVTWTLFVANPEIGQPKTLLISSKSYEFMGPVNFTTLYECV
ncbi:MAG: hypothetical protein V7718_06500 [Porticoccus sp.]